MIISPHYETIKARTIALLTAPEGFNGFTAADVYAMIEPAIGDVARLTDIFKAARCGRPAWSAAPREAMA